MAASIDLPAGWRVERPRVIAETFSSTIWRVDLSDGGTAVVKALNDFPDVWDELRGSHYLRWRDGVGAVRLLGEQDRMMLLEDVGAHSLLAELDALGDRHASEIAAELTARLLTPSDTPYPGDLQPLRERFKDLFAIASQPDAYFFYTEAAKVAAELLDTTRMEIPLHGDLHHENALRGERGWLAIDPKGALGDPAFDAANWFYNPLDRDDLCLDPERIARLAELFASATKSNPLRVMDFAFAYGCLSAAWHAGDRNDVDEARELAVAQAIRSVRFSF